MTSSFRQPLTVMTRNVYLGADTERCVHAPDGLTGEEALNAFARANHEARAIVDATDFTVRARLLAAELAGTGAELVGLQEVALWRRGPLVPARLGDAVAEEVELDFLAELVRALRDAGCAYTPVQVQTGTDVQGPSCTDDPASGSSVRLTLRDVILLRDDAPLRLLGTGGGLYASALRLDVAGLPVSYRRGFGFVDVLVGDTPVRFVNTHLEAHDPAVAAAQADELLAGPAVGGRPGDSTTIVVGDFNSDPLDPHTCGAYDRMVAAGFADLWLRWRPAEDGWTYGVRGERLDDADGSGFDRRIDLVFGRGAVELPVRWGRVTGATPDARDRSTGLWPSDHAGVVLQVG